LCRMREGGGGGPPGGKSVKEYEYVGEGRRERGEDWDKLREKDRGGKE